MKRILWMTLLLVLALPMAAFADSNVDLTNVGGTLVGTSAGLTLTDSTLIHMNGTLGNLGTVEFATGALLSGTLQGNATFDGGGSFTIVSNTNGTLFSGAFDGPVTWSLTTLANGTHNYTLTGAISGSWMGGATVYGATSQLTINTGGLLQRFDVDREWRHKHRGTGARQLDPDGNGLAGFRRSSQTQIEGLSSLRS